MRDVSSSIPYDNSQTIYINEKEEVEVYTSVNKNVVTETQISEKAELGGTAQSSYHHIFEKVSNLFIPRKRKISHSLSEEPILAKKNENESLKEFPKVVFLGTGSSIPSKLRNVSSTLLFFRCALIILLVLVNLFVFIFFNVFFQII